MATPHLRAVAEALETHLSRLFPPAQFSHAFVPMQATAAVWNELTRRPPFVGLSWGGLTLDPQSGRLLQGKSNWNVTLVTKSSRVRERYLGDATTPALLDMVLAATLGLHGAALKAADGAALGTMRLASVGNAYAQDWGGGEVAIADIGLAVLLPALLPEVLDVAMLQQVGITWDFPAPAALVENEEQP